jgi:putative transposase
MVLLRREGWAVNPKLIYRLYCEEGLGIRRKTPRRRKACQQRGERPAAARSGQHWSMDFMSDQLFNGQRFRLLTLVDNFTRESLAIRVDNGPEFISKSLDLWAYWNGVKLDFSRPGKPTDNAFIESFNGKFRQECLNQNWFLSLDDVQERVDAWRRDYNEERPQSSLGQRSPTEFAKNLRGASPP